MSDLNIRGYSYGLREIMLVSMDEGTKLKLNAAMRLEVTERHISDNLKGNDVIVSVVDFLEGVDWSLSDGGLNLDALAMLTGETPTTTGTTPNRQYGMIRQGASTAPYIQIWGRSVGDAGDSVYVKIKRAKITELAYGPFENETFLVTECSGIGIANDSNEVVEIIKLETDAVLS